MYKIIWQESEKHTLPDNKEAIQPGMVYVESAEQAALFIAELQATGALEIEMMEVASV